MEKVVSQYLSNKILEDLRRGGAIDSALAIAVNNMEIVEKMRSMIRPEDLRLLKKLINKTEYKVARIGVILIQPLQKHIPQIKSFLLKKWNSPTWESPSVSM